MSDLSSTVTLLRPRTSRPLDALIHAIDTACHVDPDERSHRLLEALQFAARQPDLLDPECRQGAPDRYRRHLLYADSAARYSLMALVWGPQQFTPVHGHHVWCALTVLEGTLTETHYRRAGSARVALDCGQCERAAGTVSYTGAGDGGIHRLGNAGTTPAISLHVYGVEGSRISTGVNDLFEAA